MKRLRELLVVGLAFCLLSVPEVGAAPAFLGTVIAAQKAHIGESKASVGATIFGGDEISTEAAGEMQVRAGAVRFLLTESSSALLGDAEGSPAATLNWGTALFSTANAKAFVLRASGAEIRPQSDVPTLARISVVSSKELLVQCDRGRLLITFEGETKAVPEASAFRVILDPGASAAADPAQNPHGAGTRDIKKRKSGRNRILLIAVAISGAGAFFAVHHFAAMESPARP